jgi:hypothetical protein
LQHDLQLYSPFVPSLDNDLLKLVSQRQSILTYPEIN